MKKQRIIRWLSALLCLCLLAGFAPAAMAYSNVSDWAKSEVAEMEALGLLPDCLLNADLSANITRGEMCKMAVEVYENLMNVEASCASGARYFTDTQEMEINFAFEQGIINGYEDQTFRPNEPLSRQDFFKITYNLMTRALFWKDESVEPSDLSQFTDAASVSDYALEPTQYMVALGVVRGTGTALEPKGTTERQAAIAMFRRAYYIVSEWLRKNDDMPVDPDPDDDGGYSGIPAWAVAEFSEVVKLGIIPSSLDNADLSKPISRAQMCSIAMLAYNGLMGTEYTPSGTAHFTDTNDPDVNAAYELKIVQGYGDGRFGPNDTLTREQFFKISCNFMQTVGYPTEQNPRVNRYSLSEFSDLKQLAEWAKTPTRLLCYIGAVKDSDGKLLPQSSTSSLEALVIFLRCYKFTTSWDGTIEQPSLADDLVAYALTFEGYDYVYGGTTPAGFDCSGFVQYVYRHFGFNITRTATSQYYNDGEHVSRSELMPGDLVFFGSGGEITHVGIYIGGGRFIHAANPRKGVIISSLSESYYNARYFGANRIIFE